MGDQITVVGEISVYPPRGGYQIVVRELKRDGVGDLLLKLHELKVELSRLGYFDKTTKKSIPPLPQTIGVITSPTGSVIQDILNVLKRRYEKFHLLLGPAKVQGVGAAEEIAAMIDLFNRHRLADVLIVGRGGGSLEDLWPFNERCVADAIHRSEIPIISAVGHETDHTIADYVADLRAPTPSAAAEIVSHEREALVKFLNEARGRLQSHLTQMIESHRHRLERYSKHPLFSDPNYILSGHLQRVDEFSQALDVALKRQVERLSLTIQGKRGQHELMGRRLQEVVQMRIKSLEGIKEHLGSLNPKNVLKKGYCIPFREKERSVIMSASSIDVGEKLSLLFSDGEVEAVANQIEEKMSDKCQK